MATTEEVRTYWEQHIHDLAITTHPVGSRAFFEDLDQYHFEKLHHLTRLVPFDSVAGKTVLEVGCGAGVDLARFAKGGARVTGVDLAQSAIDLARTNFNQQRLSGEFQVADGEHLPFPDNAFDIVYAHGVVQHTAIGRLVQGAACVKLEEDYSRSQPRRAEPVEGDEGGREHDDIRVRIQHR